MVEHKHDSRPAERLLSLMLLGAAWLLAAVAARWVYPRNVGAAETAAAIGGVLLALPVLVLAWRDLWRGRVAMNGLVALAVLAAISLQDYYTAGFVALLMLASVVLETRTAAGAGASIEALVRMSPTNANRLDAAGIETVTSITALVVGDCIRIRPGETVPVDGVISSGQTTLNEAAVTGESLPVDKGPDATVFAGSHNLTGMIEVRVNCIGADTTLGRVRELILAAERGRLPVVRIIDVFVRYYIPVVLMSALLVWLVTGDMHRVIAMLVIACPCALILAAPASMVAALAAAARQGVLLKNAADLETVARVNAFVFDKTGTLTLGEPEVLRLGPAPDIAPAELLLQAASAERFSNHPLARALQRLCEETGVVPAGDVRDFHETPGCGVAGIVNGELTLVGQFDWLREHHGVALPDMPREADERGWSVLWVARGGRCLGWIGFGDEVRADAADCLRELRELRVENLAMVTGDRQAPADSVARTINCRNVLARCLPQAKVDYVHKLRAEGFCVAVVGDGINDAPALAAGDVGIAMGAAGSDVAVHSASVALMNSNLLRLPFLLRLARRARSVVYQNITFGFLLIIIGVALAGMGTLHPIAAALMHNLGSLFVVFNSARLAGARSS